MKLFFSEFKANYEKYHFPYQVWLLKEDGDDENKIYDNGFLPIRSGLNLYYLSRNVRVALEKFEPSSENRRILKKSKNIEERLIPLSGFNYGFTVQKFCKDYSDNKLGGVFSTQDIRDIFTNNVYSHVFVFEDIETKKTVGYAVCHINDFLLQYACVFYDLGFVNQNLGAGMMLKSVIWAKENRKKYIYLGSCYEEKALYKTEFKGVEFFNGFKWSDNIEELKDLIANSSENYLLKNKQYLESFYEGDLSFLLSKFGIRVNF
ncbi:hypothetical protein COT64_02160 [Candidatus Shapirobacteria bacterium CG09_land_8_20_14_0_10_39_12]|uniref:N-end rule aminoacyl transferase C-terminal domain-containing protein n=1 Tax=Candidatus Shapirobacteria bacterium CG09_land_8_20_14_0_10_39_12 TaxID=1974885 RepID=A0A2H0WPG6_9BACT|nr:MAG: hypothetical protein COT64_02160 [Candidatus Shapirobacteria bacterium CG09_land_8_20_14_0_10_39_12]